MDTPRTQSPLESAERQQQMILRFVRLAFFALLTTVTLLLTINTQSRQQDMQDSSVLPFEWWQPVAIAIFVFCIAILVDIATPTKKLTTISAIFFGLLAGMLATAAVSAVIDLLIAAWVPKPETVSGIIALIKVMLGMALSYLGVSSVLQTQDDFRLVIPYVEFSKQVRGVRPSLLDTSVLIDARIADMATTGIMQSPMIVPGFVIAELQTLADSQDKMKRTRGRRGLDVVSRLQRLPSVDMSIDDTQTSSRSVDQALIELAERLSARIITTDTGLQRVAEIRTIQVINLHDLAMAMKPALVPGEQIVVRLVKPGEQPGQGVGYLDDGTMIVAEGGSAFVGTGDTPMLVTSSLQTASGRLIFAKVQPPAPQSGEQPEKPEKPDLRGDEGTHSGTTANAVVADADAADVTDAADAQATPESPKPTGPSDAPRSGPYPPKPPPNRTGSARNPRR